MTAHRLGRRRSRARPPVVTSSQPVGGLGSMVGYSTPTNVAWHGGANLVQGDGPGSLTAVGTRPPLDLEEFALTDQQQQEHAQEQRVRRLAHRQGMRVWKVPEGSRDYATYGAFALVDLDTKGVAPYGLTLAEVDEWLAMPSAS